MTGRFGTDTFGSSTFGATASAAGYPTITVEVAFSTANPLTTPGSWTSLAGKIRGISIRRGRSHELRRTETGEAIIRLDNRDGAFDPTYAAGTYYPNVVPMRRVRIRAVQNAVTYDLFQGFIVDWGQAYPTLLQGGGDTEVTVRALDAFALLSLFNLASYSSQVLADQPVGYWRMRESGSTLFDDSSSGQDLTVGGTGAVTTGAGPLLGGSTARTFPQTTGAGYADSTPPLSADLQNNTTDLSVEFWVNPTALPLGGLTVHLLGRYVIGGTPISPNSRASVFRWTQAGTPGLGYENVFSGSGFFAAGAWMHCVVTISDQLVSFYKNGVLHSTAILQSNPSTTALPPAAMIEVGGGASLPGSNAALAQLAIYNVALSAPRVAAHYAANFDTFEQQDAGAHITTLLSAVGWPVGEQTIGTGSTTVQAVVPSGPALDWALRIGEDTENGIFQVNGDGKVIFHSRGDLFTQAAHITSNGVLGDGGGAEIPYTAISVRYDDQDLFNTAKVTRDGGTSQYATDTASATAYGPRTIERFGSLSNSDSETNDAANYLLHRYVAPSVRVDSVTLTGVFNTPDATWAQMLGRTTHHDRVTIKRRPVAGNTITQESNVEGVSHDISFDPQQWTTTFSVVPADTYNYWNLQDAVLGLLEQTTRVGY